jgi:hypothetical protein
MALFGSASGGTDIQAASVKTRVDAPISGNVSPGSTAPAAAVGLWDLSGLLLPLAFGCQPGSKMCGSHCWSAV